MGAGACTGLGLNIGSEAGSKVVSISACGAAAGGTDPESCTRAGAGAEGVIGVGAGGMTGSAAPSGTLILQRISFGKEALTFLTSV